MDDEILAIAPEAQTMVRDSAVFRHFNERSHITIEAVRECFFGWPKYQVYTRLGQVLYVRHLENSRWKVGVYEYASQNLVARVEYTSENGPPRYEVFAVHGGVKLGNLTYKSKPKPRPCSCRLLLDLVFEGTTNLDQELRFVGKSEVPGLDRIDRQYCFIFVMNSRTQKVIAKIGREHPLATNGGQIYEISAKGATGEEKSMVFFMALLTIMQDVTM